MSGSACCRGEGAPTRLGPFPPARLVFPFVSPVRNTRVVRSSMIQRRRCGRGKGEGEACRAQRAIVGRERRRDSDPFSPRGGCSISGALSVIRAWPGHATCGPSKDSAGVCWTLLVIAEC